MVIWIERRKAGEAVDGGEEERRSRAEERRVSVSAVKVALTNQRQWG